MMRWLIISLVSLASIGCQTVTERLSPEVEEAVPQAEGSFRHGNGESSELTDDWWLQFRDPNLDKLMARLVTANPDVAAALARVDQSYALLGITRGPTYPTVRGNTGLGRRRDSINNLLFPIATPEYNRFSIGLSATWEIDLWGRVRSSVKRDRLRAEKETVNYRHALLSVQASLAQQYFAYRAAKRERDLLERSRDLAAEALKMHQARVEVGEGLQADVSQARLDLQNAETAVEAARRNSGKLLHAIAVLTGTMPSQLPDLDETAQQMFAVPAGVPSDLLIRRPDLLAADRELRAAAVQVGIRKADFLPKISLVGSGGVASLQAENLFEADSGLFDIGPQVEIPIFQYKLRKNAVAQAQAQFEEAAANFKSAFLTAVKEVDDALLDSKSYQRELQLQNQATASARETASLAKGRFDAGLGNYFDFIAAEQVHLQASAREFTLAGEYAIATVRLIQAMGGSWSDEKRE